MTPTIEDFEILDELGRGGMGTVYRARQVSLGREVAIKVIRSDLGVDAELMERLRREARATVTHRSIVPVYALGDSNGTPYIVMAYMPGGTLRDRLGREHRLSQTATAEIGASIAEALASAHHHGIVHRDVKPSNVLMDGAGNAHLADFGVARLDDMTRMTQTSVVVGTADYLAPELTQGGSATPASDIYSLGAMLYECLKGHPPFPADGTLAVMFRHRFDDVPSLPDDINDRLRALIEQCLAKRPEDRPPDAATVARRLQDLPGSISAASPDKPTVQRASPGDAPRAAAPVAPGSARTKGRRRRRVAVIVGVVAVLVAAGIGGVLLLSAGSGSSRSSGPVTPGRDSGASTTTGFDLEPPTELSVSVVEPSCDPSTCSVQLTYRDNSIGETSYQANVLGETGTFVFFGAAHEGIGTLYTSPADAAAPALKEKRYCLTVNARMREAVGPSSDVLCFKITADNQLVVG